MGKRKLQYNSTEEPMKKKEKKTYDTTNKTEGSDLIVPKSAKNRSHKMSRKKALNLTGKKERNVREKSTRKPVSMQNLLSEKLRLVQQNRLKKEAVKKEEKEEFNKHDIRHDTEKSAVAHVGTTHERTEYIEPKENIKKHKKNKKRKETVTDNVKKVINEPVIDESQEDEEEKEDPEKAAVRMKKREKRKQKKLEKEKIRQQNEEKAGTAKVAAIDYLNQWKNRRQDWKFLKVRQVWLLKNMYDQELVSFHEDHWWINIIPSSNLRRSVHTVCEFRI